MTIEEQKTSVDEDSGRATDVVDRELVEDSDDDRELWEDFSEELRASLDAVARGDATKTAQRVAKKLELSW